MSTRFLTRISLFMILAGLVLAACGGEAAPTVTVAPTATTGAVTQPTGATQPTSAATAVEPQHTAPPGATASPGTGANNGTKRGDISVIWFAWQPCQALTDQSKNFPGANVTVRCVPIAQWHDQIFNDFAAKGGADIVILDSQFIGEAVQGGHVRELTDWMKANIETADYVPAALSAYGEYPQGSGKYYGIAAEADTQMLVYRKDLFDKAGRQVPKTWQELLQTAQFFKQNAGQQGVQGGYTTHWCGTPACYDQMATHWNQIMWSFGGEIWDPKTYKVEGLINSETGVRALEFDKQLFDTGLQGQGNFQFNETVDAICTGKVPMATIWFGFGPAFEDEKGCRESKNLAYGIVPGQDKHFISLGGMGLSVSTYSKNPDLALEYVKWFESKEQQLDWAKRGGFSARKSVLESEEFKNAARYNPAFAESYTKVKDFWNIPEYNKLLQPQMEQLNLAVTGQKGAKEALDEIARKQQQELEDAYPDGPPTQ